MTNDEIRQWTATVDSCRMSHVGHDVKIRAPAWLIRAVDDELIRLRAEVARLTAERDAIVLMWFRELEDTLAGERRLYDVVGPDIYTGSAWRSAASRPTRSTCRRTYRSPNGRRTAMTVDEIRRWTDTVDFCRMSHARNNAEAHVFAGLIKAVDDELTRLRSEVARLESEAADRAELFGRIQGSYAKALLGEPVDADAEHYLGVIEARQVRALLDESRSEVARLNRSLVAMTRALDGAGEALAGALAERDAVIGLLIDRDITVVETWCALLPDSSSPLGFAWTTDIEVRDEAVAMVRRAAGLTDAANPTGPPAEPPSRMLPTPADPSRVYCPWCDGSWVASDLPDRCFVCSEGDHEIECPSCGRPFVVYTDFTLVHTCSKRIEDQAEDG